MYKYINYVLANYFSSSIGYSEAESIEWLKEHLEGSREFRTNLSEDYKRAFLDPQFSWLDAFAEYDIAYFADEKAAQVYAKRILEQATLG